MLASSVLVRECFGVGRARGEDALRRGTGADSRGHIGGQNRSSAGEGDEKMRGGGERGWVGRGGGIRGAENYARGEFVAGAKRRRTTRVLALEGVQDPGNVGTLVRTAVAFGWEYVALLPGTCDPFNDKAMRAARGATFRVDFVAFDSFEELARRERSGDEIVRRRTERRARRRSRARAGGGEGVFSARNGGERVERGGVARACEPVAVPMSGDMESLNVGVAGSVLMYLMKSGAQC